MKVLCFDIGGTDIKYGIVKDGKVLVKKSMRTDAFLGEKAIIDKIVLASKELLKEHTVVGAAVSCAGSINYETGEILIPSESAKCMKGMNFKKIFKDNFYLDCVADNDVNCFAKAEAIDGFAKKCKQFLMMTLGTGIGGAIVNEKNVWRGLHYNGGEFGRMLLGSTEQKYESIGATSVLVRNARKAGLKVENGIDMFRLFDEKDPKAITIVKDWYHDVAWGIANLIYIFNPEAVVIGGGVANRSTLCTEIKRELKKILNPDFYDTVKLLNSKFGNDGGMIGAYYNFAETRK